MLEESERSGLLALARRSIASGLGRDAPARLPEAAWTPPLLELRASFTTLKLDGRLRGCCGAIEPRRTLVADVWHNAWASAFVDPRFRPLRAGELAALEIGISVLTPLEPIAADTEAELMACLRPGIDGLVLGCGAARATFLPAVWQQLPQPGDFIAQLKLKAGLAGLPFSAGMRAFRYRTESFQSARGVELAA